MKRLIDIFVSLCVLVLLAPFFVLIAIAIRLETAGNPIFSQTRVGYRGRLFKVLKFRSMVQSAEKYGFQTTQGDARITRVGQFLRKSSLDELPQLINVLKGEMSIVGPRPFVPIQEKDFPTGFWEKRHTVRPGITGLSQAKFRSAASIAELIEHDKKYVDQVSLCFDLKIVWQTVASLAARDKN